MREIILGTAGHVDHGKTSLIQALTGIETDRLQEEKKRGITIELGFAYLDLPCGHRIGIVDVPGHEKFVRNMVAGAAGMDLVAFVIAADEGIMPQTREHFEICRLLGVKDGIIVLTKKDMVDNEWLDMVREEVRDFFKDSFLGKAPIIAVSSVTGEGLDDLKKILDDKIAAMTFHEEFGPFRLAVDRVFSMKGFGTVITGTSLSGRISVGDKLMFYPGGLTAKIRGIQVHGKDVQLIEAGHRTAINLQGIEKDEINRGDMAAMPGSLVSSSQFDADLHYLSSNSKELKNRAPVRVHVGTREIIGRVVLMESDTVRPGDDAFVQLVLQEPAALWTGDRYIIRSYSPITTIGGGAVLNNAPRKRKRTAQKDRNSNHQAFSIYQNGSFEERMLLFLKESGSEGLTADQLSTRLGLFGKKLQKQLQAPISSGKILVIESDRQRLLAAPILDRITTTLLNVLQQYHEQYPLKTGLAKEELRSRLQPAVDPKLFHYALGALVKKKQIVQDQSEVRLAGFEVTLQVDEQALQEKITGVYRDAGLTPPTIKDLFRTLGEYPEAQVKQVLDLLLQEGKLIKITESLYFQAGQLDRLARRLTTFIQKEGEIDAPRFKDLTGLTRKFSIPLLEYFDRIKLTIRIGDKRALRKG